MYKANGKHITTGGGLSMDQRYYLLTIAHGPANQQDTPLHRHYYALQSREQAEKYAEWLAALLNCSWDVNPCLPCKGTGFVGLTKCALCHGHGMSYKNGPERPIEPEQVPQCLTQSQLTLFQPGFASSSQSSPAVRQSSYSESEHARLRSGASLSSTTTTVEKLTPQLALVAVSSRESTKSSSTKPKAPPTSALPDESPSSVTQS